MHFTYKYLKCIYFKWVMPRTAREPYDLYGAYLEKQCILHGIDLSQKITEASRTGYLTNST